jgi:SWI/SNF-related matrix-associated actin-dependent regulator 1 of chromatin subfamily A
MPILEDIAWFDTQKQVVNIQFPYSPQKVSQIKELSGRRWVSEKKIWTADLSVETIEKLIEWQFNVSPDLRHWLHEQTKEVSTEALNIPGLVKDLMGYQMESVAFTISRNCRAILGDDMGLGKTAEAIACLLYLKSLGLNRTIIACPATLKLNWRRELKKWGNLDCRIVNGRYDSEKPENFLGDEILILNYDILAHTLFRQCTCKMKNPNCKLCKGKGIITVHTLRPDISLLNPKLVILDEAQAFKENDAIRTKMVKELCKAVPHVIPITGTLIINRPREMYNAINLVNPALFPSFWRFAQRYCDPKYTRWGWNFNGASNTMELHDKLTRTIMSRHMKVDVLKDLPPKIRSVVPMELDNWDDYKKAEHDVVEWLRGIDPLAAMNASMAQALARFEVLKQLAVNGKLRQALGWIDNFLESGEKLVAFAWHTAIINAIMERFGDIAVKVDGSVSPIGRYKAVDAFQTDPKCRLFVGQIKAAGIGLTLTAASSTAFLELDWSPGNHDQAEDRVHRIGQEDDSVNAYYLLAEGTIEDDIAEILDSKRKVLDAVLNGTDTPMESILTELMKRIREKGVSE